jgi:hypothetical protein
MTTNPSRKTQRLARIIISSMLFVIPKTLAKGHGTVYIGDSFSTLIRSGCLTLCDRFRWEVHNYSLPTS